MVARYMVSLFLVLACGEVHVTLFSVVAWYFWCPYSYKLFGLLCTWFKPITNKRNTCSCSPLLLICSFFHLALPYFSYECSLSFFHIFLTDLSFWHLQLRDSYVHLFNGSPHLASYGICDVLYVHASHFVVWCVSLNLSSFCRLFMFHWIIKFSCLYYILFNPFCNVLLSRMLMFFLLIKSSTCA